MSKDTTKDTMTPDDVRRAKEIATTVYPLSATTVYPLSFNLGPSPFASPSEAWPADPLIAAVVWKLPPGGQPFPADKRTAWLKMMAMAFDVAYGVAEDMPDFLAPAALTRGLAAGFEASNAVVRAAAEGVAPAVRAGHAGHNFYIDREGYVCSAGGAPADLEDVPEDEVIFDYRPVNGDFRDRDGITWADGRRGIAGLAGGCSFCGPG